MLVVVGAFRQLTPLDASPGDLWVNIMCIVGGSVGIVLALIMGRSRRP